MTPADRATAFRAATRHLRGHGPPDPRAVLRTLADEADEPADVYGEGAAIEALERDVAERFGKPAAVFVPSGTMAQQVALRIAADARGCRTVAFHPTIRSAVAPARCRSSGATVTATCRAWRSTPRRARGGRACRGRKAAMCST